MVVKTNVQTIKPNQCKWCQGKGWVAVNNVIGFAVCDACAGTGLSDYPEHLDPYYNWNDEEEEENKEN